MDIRARIEELITQRGWSQYQFSQKAGLSQSTISSIMNREYEPTVQTIENCCRAFGITITEFFSADFQSLTMDEMQLISNWRNLDSDMKEALLQVIFLIQQGKRQYDKTKEE